MNQETTQILSCKTMSSLEIAAFAKKRHDNILVDIREMFDELGVPEGDLSKFQGIYLDKYKHEKPCYNLPKRECLILVAKYSLPIRAAIIDRWLELDKNDWVIHNQLVPDYMLSTEIATRSTKSHFHVLRDIRAMLFELYGEHGDLKYQKTEEFAPNRKRTIYMLPERECLILIAKYSLKIRIEIIDKWLALETPDVTSLNIVDTLKHLKERVKQDDDLISSMVGDIERLRSALVRSELNNGFRVTSLELADLLGKSHDSVKYTIRKMLNVLRRALGMEKYSALPSMFMEEVDNGTKERDTVFKLPRNFALLLAGRYAGDHKAVGKLVGLCLDTDFAEGNISPEIQQLVDQESLELINKTAASYTRLVKDFPKDLDLSVSQVSKFTIDKVQIELYLKGVSISRSCPIDATVFEILISIVKCRFWESELSDESRMVNIPLLANLNATETVGLYRHIYENFVQIPVTAHESMCVIYENSRLLTIAYISTGPSRLEDEEEPV